MKCLSTLFSPLYWLLASSFFTCFLSDSFDSTMPSVKFRMGSSYFDSGSAACATNTSSGNTFYTSIGSQTTPSGPTALDGLWVYGFVGGEMGACGWVQGNTSGPGVVQYETCPYPGETQIVGGHMQCGTGPLEPDCPTAGTKKNSSVAVSGISGQQGIGGSLCADSGGSSCGIKCNSGIASYNDTSGQSSVYCDSYEFTGSGCTSAPVAAPVTSVPATNQATPINSPPKSKQDCPGGSGFAEVNNVGMCLPSGTSYSGGATTTTSSTGSVTSTSTTVINKGGTSTTTTVNTYKDAAGNTTYEGTSTTSGSINQAAGGGTGQGDKPSFGDAPTFDPTLPQESTFTIKAQGNPVFSTEIFQSSASCPAPIVFSAMNQEFSIDFAAVCSYADMIRGMVLLISAIAAMRIVTTS